MIWLVLTIYSRLRLQYFYTVVNFITINTQKQKQCARNFNSFYFLFLSKMFKMIQGMKKNAFKKK